MAEMGFFPASSQPEQEQARQCVERLSACLVDHAWRLPHDSALLSCFLLCRQHARFVDHDRLRAALVCAARRSGQQGLSHEPLAPGFISSVMEGFSRLVVHLFDHPPTGLKEEDDALGDVCHLFVSSLVRWRRVLAASDDHQHVEEECAQSAIQSAVEWMKRRMDERYAGSIGRDCDDLLRWLGQGGASLVRRLRHATGTTGKGHARGRQK
jgi:hypothetical protein